jgi:hypothetical protein
MIGVYRLAALDWRRQAKYSSSALNPPSLTMGPAFGALTRCIICGADSL